MPRLIDWDDLQALDDGTTKIMALSSLSAIFIQALSVFYNNRFCWVAGANDVTDEQWDAIQALISDTELDLMSGLIGMILPNVLADISNLNVLECDGSSYLRVDYPELYAAIAPAYIIDANNFRVPDLSDRVPLGATITNPIGTQGGESDVTLNVNQLPAHLHTTQPHDHTYVGTIPAVETGGAGPPLPAVMSAAAVTGPATVIVDQTGNDEAHNNMQPYEAISFVIVAG